MATLDLLHPIARLKGRLSFGLTPWRRKGDGGTRSPLPTATAIWSEVWHAPESWLLSIEERLRSQRLRVRRGGGYEQWDLEVQGGLFAAARVHMAIEEHGAGRQLARFRVTPRLNLLAWFLLPFFACLSLAAGMASAWIACGALGMATILLCARTVREAMRANAEITRVLRAPAHLRPDLLRRERQNGMGSARPISDDDVNHTNRLTA